MRRHRRRNDAGRLTMRLRAFLTVLLLLPCAGAPAGDFFKLTGHGGPVRGIDVSPDGSRLLTASFDYSVGLWQAGAPVWLEAHDAAVNAVRFIDASTAVSAGDDNHVRLWDLERGVSERLGSHRAKVVSLALSPDRSLVASASWDGRIGLWPVSGAPARFLEGHSAGVNDVVFSADGARLYSGSDGRDGPRLGRGARRPDAAHAEGALRHQHAGARRGGRLARLWRGGRRNPRSRPGERPRDRRLHPPAPADAWPWPSTRRAAGSRSATARASSRSSTAGPGRSSGTSARRCAGRSGRSPSRPTGRTSWPAA